MKWFLKLSLLFILIGCNQSTPITLTGVKITACGSEGLDVLTEDETLTSYYMPGTAPACSNWEKSEYWDIKLTKTPKEYDGQRQQYEFVSAQTTI